MSENDKTDVELLQEIMPGSTTFKAKILCPSCGWHFKKGLTDPEGKHTEPAPNMFLICGQCCKILRFNEERVLVAAMKEDIDKLPKEDKESLGVAYVITRMARDALGPDPEMKGEQQ